MISSCRLRSFSSRSVLLFRSSSIESSGGLRMEVPLARFLGLSRLSSIRCLRFDFLSPAFVFLLFLSRFLLLMDESSPEHTGSSSLFDADDS